VGGGAYEKGDRSHAIAVYVNRANPLERITLAQLDAIYSATRRRGSAAAVTTWGQLGLTGEWANHPIIAYAARRPNGIADAFQDRVLLTGDFKASIHERANSPTARVLDSVVDAVGADANGIGYAGFAQATSAVKALAVAETEAGPYVAGTLASVTDQSYPLTRFVYIAINKAPGKPLTPAVREFLRLVLSREGQQVLVEEGYFLPLPAAIVREELARLN
jgi:phosphate transport system substrate-binding protein